MKIFFIYPNVDGYGRIPLGVSLISTILLKDGHQIELFDTTFILEKDNADNVLRQKAKFVLPTDISNLYDPHSKEEIDEMLKARIKKFSPDLIAISILEDNYQYADHLLGVVKKIDSKIPVIAGGSTPTVVPDVIIENPHIDYLVQGEGEEAMKEFCGLMESGKSIEGVRNLWYKKNGTVKHNPVRSFVDMDTLPVQDLDMWDKRHYVKPYTGELSQAGYFEMSRGCLNQCSYCINFSCRNSLKGAGNYYRRKSVKKAIEEIKTLKAKYGFNRIFFCDDNFLLMPHEKMKEFVQLWKSEVNLPYWINTTAETIDRERLSGLKETGCCGIGMGIESGSEWMRENILMRRHISNEKIEETFKLIHEFGIRTTANNMIGFPGEYEEDMFETIKLCKEAKPKSFDVTFVAPYIGTAVHKVSKELGYIEVWDKPGFKGMSKNIFMRRGPVIDNPHISKEKLMDVYYNFMDYIEGKLPIPDKFLKPAPGSTKDAPQRGDMGKEAADIFKSLMKKDNC